MDSTHLAAEQMRSEILDRALIGVDPSGEEALLCRSQAMIDRLKAMPLGDTPLERLLAYGRAVGMSASRLQHKPLRDPRTALVHEAWHWDLVGRFLPAPRDEAR